MAQCVQCEAPLPAGAQFCASCGAQVTVQTQPRVDPYLGRVFAQKYRVEVLLGEGGMGRVYRAVQLSLDKVVCLKVLRAELANDPATQARFQREARAASRLNHPNSIQVMDFGAAEAGELYLAMEYISGRDLQQLLAAEFPLDESRVCHVMAQVLDALSEAHAQHVIHRDLKPENIMVHDHRGDPDFVKVLDFGIAKIQDTDTQPKLTRAGLVCGTPEYMSPEQARGQELDPRSDLYSAGVILYQMMTGTLPFSADSPIGFVTAHLHERPDPPRVRRPQVSPEMESLILRALSKDREGRPASAAAMRDELVALGGISARPKSRPPEASGASETLAGNLALPPRRRAKWRGIVTGALVVTLVLGGGAYALRFILPAHGSAEAAPRASQGSQEAATAAYGEGKRLYQEALAEADAEKRTDLLTQARNRFYHSYLLNPQNPAPLRLMGTCYQALGDSKSAAANFKLYIETVPPPPDAAAVKKMLAELDSQAK